MWEDNSLISCEEVEKKYKLVIGKRHRHSCMDNLLIKTKLFIL